MFRAVPTQQEQSQWKGSDESKRCNRQKAKQTRCSSRRHSVRTRRCACPGLPQPLHGWEPGPDWALLRSAGGCLLHNTGVLSCTRPGTVFCKIFGNGSPNLDLQPSVWKCPIGKLQTPQREQNATDSSAPAAFHKHFRRKSSGPTIASHVDVTCPPEVRGRALEAPART